MAAGDVKVSLTKNRGFSCNVFDGADDYVEVAHDKRQLGAALTNGFTISAWINPRSIGESAGRIIDKSSADSASNGFRFFCSTTNRVGFSINQASGVVSSNNAVLYGTWYHVLVTVSANSLGNLFVDGALTGNANTDLVQALSTITTTNAMLIGNRSTATDRSFNGSIRDVKMWDRVLTTAERAEDYAGTTPKTGLIHWFKLGGDYADYGAVGVAATNSGSVPAVVDDSLAVVVKAQRVAATDSWMVYRGLGGQVGVVNIE
jgi:hypothetical protein